MASQKQLSLLGISAFCESMAAMLDAGIDISEAVSLLKQKGKQGILNQGLDIMEESLKEGMNLSASMAQSGLFPDYALRMVEAGEATGKSEEALKTLSDYYASAHGLRQKITSTIVYPMAMIFLIIIVLFLMLKKVLPAFEGVYQTLTGSLSQSSYHYISYAFVFCRVVLVFMLALVFVILACLLLYRTGAKDFVLRVLKLLPGADAILENLALYRFTSAFGVYLSSGFAQDDAAQKAKEMAEYGPVADRIGKAQEEMAKGNGFAMAANEACLYEPVYGRMLIPAERSGNIEEALSRLSDLLSQSVTALSDRLLSSLESLLSGVLMIAVAAALLSVMLPLIGIMNSIG